MTYDELQTNIKAYLEEDSDEFNAALPTVISQAESNIYFRLSGELPCYYKSATANVVVSGSSYYVDYSRLGILSLEFVQCTDANVGTVTDCPVMQKRTESYVKSLYPNRQRDDANEFAVPEMYYDNNYRMYPAPLNSPAGAQFYLDGRGKEPALSDSNQTNWVSENAPNLLLQACLLEASQILRKDPMPYRERFEEAIQGLGGHAMRVMNDDNKTPLRMPDE